MASATATKKRNSMITSVFVSSRENSLENVACASRRNNTSKNPTRNNPSDAATTRSVLVTDAISPNSASPSSASGVRIMPNASASVNATPTSASMETANFLSKKKMPTVTTASAANAPINGFIPIRNASAMPGSATCDSTSDTSAIRRTIMNTPSKDAATETIMLVMRNGRSIVFLFMFVRIQCHIAAVEFFKHILTQCRPWRPHT